LFESGLYYRRKVVAFGAIAIVVLACIAILFNGAIEKVLDFFYLILDARQIHETEWGSVFLNEILE
jgi:hypothetical protein